MAKKSGWTWCHEEHCHCGNPKRCGLPAGRCSSASAGCLGLMSLMLVAPTALVGLVVKAVRR